MLRIERSPAALEDLIDILVYIARDSEEQARRQLDRIDAALGMLSMFPRCGPLRAEIAPDVRSYPVNSYVIFYRIRDEKLEVIRVLHGARDVETVIRDHLGKLLS